MSKVENFETKIYSNEEGWKIWLCTERTELKVTSFFKAQYPVKGTPHCSKSIISIGGYHDTVSGIYSQLKLSRNFLKYTVGPTYRDEEYANWFYETMNKLIETEALFPIIKEHNRKTLHRFHLLPGYSGKHDSERTYVVYHDKVMATLAKFTIRYKEEGGYETHVLCIGDAKGKMIKTDHTFTEPFLRPEFLSNALFRVFNPLLDEMGVDKEERLDIVGDMTHYFEKCRHGIWDLLRLSNKK